MYSYYRDGHPASTGSGMEQTQTQCPGWMHHVPLAGQLPAGPCVTAVGWSCTACTRWRKWCWRCFIALWEPSGWVWPATGQLPFKYTHLSWVTVKGYTWWQLVLAVPSRCAFTFLTNKGQCIFIQWPSSAQTEKQWGGYRSSEAAKEPSHHQKLTGLG